MALIPYIIVALLLKLYLTRGFLQAFPGTKMHWVYLVLSIVSLVGGWIAIMNAFRDHSLNFWRNIIIAFMISVLICELILAVFFIVDDIALLIQKITPSNVLSDPEKGRRRFVKALGVGLTALPFASYIYGITKGKYDFKVIEQELSFSDLPKAFDGFRIVQFSDMHSGGLDSMKSVKRGFEIIKEQGADLILFTGDLVNHSAREVTPYLELLKSLHAPFGKYSVLGNHDYYYRDDHYDGVNDAHTNLNRLKAYHGEAKFTLLNNENTTLEKNGEYIRLIGVENWGKGFIQKGDLDLAVEGCVDDEFSILMSHDPTHWDAKVLPHKKHINLTLAGHTHGMQMGIETLGLKWSPGQYVYPRWAGLYTEKNQHLYVNRGFGWTGFAGRVGIPPEITVFTLKSA